MLLELVLDDVRGCGIGATSNGIPPIRRYSERLKTLSRFPGFLKSAPRLVSAEFCFEPLIYREKPGPEYDIGQQH